MLEKLDAYVFKQVADIQTRWFEDGLHFPSIAINVSAERLFDPGLADQVECTLKPHHKLSFELLETAFLDVLPREAQLTLERLRKAGIRIELDDFGSGHASIVAMRKIRPDRIKIDSSLAGLIHVRPEQTRFLQCLSEIARLENCDVLVEGIETAAHLHAMRHVDCDVLQGYALGHPLPLTAFEALVTEHQTSLAPRSGRDRGLQPRA